MAALGDAAGLSPDAELLADAAGLSPGAEALVGAAVPRLGADVVVGRQVVAESHAVAAPAAVSLVRVYPMAVQGGVAEAERLSSSRQAPGAMRAAFKVALFPSRRTGELCKFAATQRHTLGASK